MTRNRAFVARANELRGDARLRSFVANSGWTMASTAVASVTALGETIILARSLAPGRLGAFLLLIAYPEAVLQILAFRVPNAMTKYLGEFLAQGRSREGAAIVKLLWLIDVGVAGIAFVVVAASAYPVSGLLLHDRSLGSLVIAYAGALFIGSMDSASGAAMRVAERFRLSFLAGASTTTLRVVLIGIAALVGGGLSAFVWARVGAQVATTIILGWAAVSALKPHLWADRRAPIDSLRPRYRELRRFLIGTNLLGLIRAISTKLDTILVGAIGSPVAVALYRLALQFAKVPLLLTDALNAAIYPDFARDIGSGRQKEAESLARRLTFLLIPLGLAIGGGLIVAAPSLVSFVLGSRFAGAVTPLRIMLLGVVPWVIIFWGPAFLLALGRAGDLVKFEIVAVTAQFAAIAALVPSFGATGAAVGFALIYLVFVALQLRFLWRTRFFAPVLRPSRASE